MFHIFAILLDLVCHLDPRETGSNCQYLELPRQRVLAESADRSNPCRRKTHIVRDIWDIVATGTGCGVVPPPVAIDRVQVRRHRCLSVL